ncbi:MFS transporter [Paenibacillus glucanolyticus]|uniref:MFS transporter n=1 Tax=Paenibacillus TaxID=44249 RepID=UPI0003E24479|nr:MULTISPECIES: MFS transporter [Paenibacillus]ANA82227.1 MFS transporter [Paenibacillus glucanolyticus]AVV59035.1 MFS transporter [Paenibacillus glucanolyticus]ETT41649.1 major facilitator superfamily protein [Paenibacillus sp. FSL R5-808]MPY16459.1 MFS transporter [Paenibacillus glucanolyticus]
MAEVVNPRQGRTHYFILIAVVVAAGLSQGLLLPVLAIFLERMGISSSMNGLNAAALYVGSFAMTLVAERVLGWVGFKKLIVSGLVLVMLSLVAFPLIPSVAVWFVLRVLVGIGDSALHYAAQLWVLMMSTAKNRGRSISFYGMSYGLGFSIGPLGIPLLKYGEAVPFLILAVLFLFILLVVLFKLPNLKPEKSENGEQQPGGRYLKSYRLAWFALIPAFLYGYMEAGINSNFPVYGLRSGFTLGEISALLPFVGIGGLLLQLPLGIWSDKFGRKRVLTIAGIVGGCCFLLIPVAGTNFWAILVLLTLAGGLVGSFFSLGLAYAADILPRVLLPAANVVASFHFNAGSIAGPNAGGAIMETGWNGGIFVLLGGLYILFACTGLWFKVKSVSPQQ